MTTQNNPHKFTLGQRVRDRVTGFEGIVTTRVEHLNGCVQYLVKPHVVEKDDEASKMPDGHYIDDVQLAYVDEGIVESVGHFHTRLAVEQATGGPSHREGELPR